MKIKFFILSFFIAFSTTTVAEEWITEEVLKQLSEVRSELKTLQNEVRLLREQSSKSSAAKPAAKKLPNIGVSTAPTVGDSKAKYALIEFSDYQCPYCKRHYKQTFPKLKEKYVDTGKVKYVMKQFALDFHSKAKGASIAALCIEKLSAGKYWGMHESIFSGEVSLNKTAYIAYAESQGLDSKEYESCLASDEVSKRVDLDMAEGKSAGIRGTPAFVFGEVKGDEVVGIRMISGARPFTYFDNLIESAL